MKKVLIIAQNETKAEEAAAHFNGLTVRKVFPGTKRFPRHFDAVVIYHNDVKEINFIKDELHKYADAPIKAFFGKTIYDQAATHHAKPFTHDQAGLLVEHLNQQYQQLIEVITKVFKTFDKDGSGYIDIKELADVAKELGRPLDAAELEECMQDLDTNKDDQITFEEFRKWWLSGRQGLSSIMRRLLALKLKTVKFFGTINDTLNEVIQEAVSQSVDINTSHLKVSLNKVEHAGTTLFAKLMVLSNEVHEEYHKIRALHNIQGSESWVGSLNIQIKNGKAQEVQGLLSTFFQENELTQQLGLSVVTEGPNNLLVGLALPMIPYDVIPFDPCSLETVQQNLKVNQDVEVSIRLAASPKDLLTEGGEPAIKLLLQGLSVEVRLNVWRKISDVLIKVIEQGELEATVLPLFGILAPAFLLKVKGDLEIEVDEQMKETIFSNPIVEPMLMDALTLIHAIGGCNSDEQEEIDNHLNTVVFPPLAAIYRALDGHLGDEISFSVVQPKLGVAGRISGEELGLLLRHGIKLFK